MRLVKTTSFSVPRLFAIVTLFAILIDGIVTIVFFLNDWKQGAFNFTIFHLPLFILGYFFWFGRKLSVILSAFLLSVLLGLYGIGYLYIAAEAYSFSIFLLAVANFIAAVSSVLSLINRFRRLD